MHPRNARDAKLASLSMFYRKWIVSMATIVKLKMYNISVHIQADFTKLVSEHVLEQYRSNGVMTLRFQGK